MNPLRLVVVTRRFWPLMDEAEGLLTALVVELVRAGVRVTVLTARWDSEWPYQIDFHGATVVRLPYSNRRGWGTLRYMRALTHWLRAHAGELHMVYVCGMRHDAYAALAALRGGETPMALRVDRVGLTGECHWQLDAAFGHRIKKRCFEAAAFVATGPAAQNELIAAGYPRPRIRYLPNGVAPAVARVPATRDAAREALGEAHPALVLRETTRLAVYIGELHEEKGLLHLLHAWRLVRESLPDARLWIIGDGPYSSALQAEITELGLAPWVQTPGCFDEDEDVLLAADALVNPSLEESLPAPVLRAMAVGCPVVVTDIPGHRELVTHEQEGLLVPVEKPEAIAASLLRLWQEPAAAAQWAETARAKAMREFPLERTVRAHLDLFEELSRTRLDAAAT